MNKGAISTQLSAALFFVGIFLAILLIVAVVFLCLWAKQGFFKAKRLRKKVKNLRLVGDGDFYERNLRAMRENFASAAKKEVHLKEKDFRIALRNFSPLYHGAFSLMNSGNVYYGCIVQANSSAFHSFIATLPADIIYSADPFFEKNPEELKKIAWAMFAQKDKSFTAENSYMKYINDEYSAPYHVLLPAELCGGRKVYLTVVAIPGRDVLCKLTDSLLPILTNPNVSLSTLVLNQEWWTDEMRLNFACPSFARETAAEDIFSL